jgi:CarD family transcriptional regulator
MKARPKVRPNRAARSSRPAHKSAAPKNPRTHAKKPSKNPAAAARKPAPARRAKTPAKKITRKPAAKPSRKRASVATRYRVNEQIVYPLQGVGLVRAIEKRPFRDQTLLYYIIYLEVSDMTVMVPVDKSDVLGIRPIVARKEAQKAMAILAEDHEPVTADWKLRYQMNLELLKRGSIQDIATVVRTLYKRSTVKELPILERKLYDNALRLLIDEASFSLGKSKEEMEKLIFAQMGRRN